MKKKRMVGIVFLIACLIIVFVNLYAMGNTCYDCGSVTNCEEGNGWDDSGYASCEVVYSVWNPDWAVGCQLSGWNCIPVPI